MEKSKVKVIVVIVSTVLLCGAIAGTAAIISGCNRNNAVNTTESSSSNTNENSNTTENPTTKDNVKETTTIEKTEENSENVTEADTEDSQASTEDEETIEVIDETTKAPQPTTVAPTEAPTKAPQPTTVAPTEAPTKAPQPTTVAPTEAPSKAPQPTTVAPTEAPTKAPQPTTVAPTEEPTTVPVIHGENGRILDTIYFHYTDAVPYGIWKLPESREEFIKVIKDGDVNDSCIGRGGWVNDTKLLQVDFFGIGFILGETTINEIRTFYGEPYAIEYNDTNTVLFYEYKVEGLIMYFVFQNVDSSWYSVYICLEEEAGIEESEKL